MALKRYGYPTKLTLELDPFKADVYYDLPPLREYRLTGARLLRLSCPEPGLAGLTLETEG